MVLFDSLEVPKTFGKDGVRKCPVMRG